MNEIADTPLTTADLVARHTVARVDIRPISIADDALQHAGVKIKTKSGEAVGHSMAGSLQKLKQQPRHPDAVGKEDPQLGVMKQLEMWIEPDNADSANYPIVEIPSSEALASETGMMTLVNQTYRVVEQWAVQDPTGKRKQLKDFITGTYRQYDKSTLAYQVVLASEKIARLLTLDSLPDSLRQSLIANKAFIDGNVIPLLIEDPDHFTALKTNAAEYLDEPQTRGKRKTGELGETYVEKAKRVLSGNTVRGDSAPDRAGRTFHTVIKAEANKPVAAVALEKQLLEAASTVNLIKLLEMAEEHGVDIPAIRAGLQDLIAEVPQEIVGPEGELTAQGIDWINRVIGQIYPIGNFIRDQFPHDTAYLLSQVLESRHAICAGKAMMLTSIYRLLGLDARYTTVEVFADPFYGAGGHVESHINLPQGIIFAVDANNINMSSSNDKSRGIDLTKPNHNIAVLAPAQIIYRDPEELLRTLAVPQYLGSAQAAFLTETAGHHLYSVYGYSHALMSQADRPVYFDSFNMAQLLDDGRTSFLSGDFQPQDVLGQREYYLRLALDTNPRSSDVLAAYGKLLDRNSDLLVTESRPQAQILQEALSMLRRSVRMNPHNSSSYQYLGSLLTRHPEVLESEGVSRDDVMRQAYRHFIRAVRLNPGNIYARTDIISMLQFNPELTDVPVDQVLWHIAFQYEEILKEAPNSKIHLQRFIKFIKANRDYFIHYYDSEAHYEEQLREYQERLGK